MAAAAFFAAERSIRERSHALFAFESEEWCY